MSTQDKYELDAAILSSQREGLRELCGALDKKVSAIAKQSGLDTTNFTNIQKGEGYPLKISSIKKIYKSTFDTFMNLTRAKQAQYRNAFTLLYCIEELDNTEDLYTDFARLIVKIAEKKEVEPTYTEVESIANTYYDSVLEALTTIKK